MHRFPAWLISCGFLLLNGGVCHTQTLTARLVEIQNKYQVVGMSVAVVRDTTIAYLGHFGKRDLGRNLPVTDSTVYRIASISKFFTATALLQLYEKGLFKLDDDVSDYLGFTLRNPAFPAQPITFRKILSHTSSLRDGSGYNSFLSATYTANPPPLLTSVLLAGGVYYTADMFSTTRGPEANYFTYANINFGLAGTLVEKISGERFDTYCRRHIFEPLGLAASFNVNDLPNINNVAVLYRKSGSNWVAQTDNYHGTKPALRDLSGYLPGANGVIFGPQGGLRISAADLAQFMIIQKNFGTLRGQNILNDTTVALLQTTVWNYSGTNGSTAGGLFRNYALGNHASGDLLPGQWLIGHCGEAYGLISDMYFSRAANYGIIFITNGGVWGSGTYSGWSNLEEEIYTACFAALPNLTTRSAPHPERREFALAPNFPNPFNATTHIRYHLPQATFTTLEVADLSGRTVARLVHQLQPAGWQEFEWQADALPAGIYCINLRTASASLSRKCLLLK